MTETLWRLIEITSDFCVNRPADVPLKGDSAVCQDAYIFGIDVEDYVAALEKEFGPIVWEIPWLNFTDQTSSFRGCGTILVFPWLLWRCLMLLIRGGPLIPRPDPRGFAPRLELRHIAAVIDRGEWFKP